jgi:hypothetical protein
VIAQLISSASGNVGPAVTFYGTSATAVVSWTDLSPVTYQSPIQYLVSIRTISAFNTLSIAAGRSALVVRELPGPTSGVAGVIQFLPPQSGLVVQYDPNNPLSVVTDGSGGISQLTDLSGNNNHGTQATPANRAGYLRSDPALNNLGSVNPTSGSGSTGLTLPFSLPQPYTVIFVAVTGAVGNQAVTGGTNLLAFATGGTALAFRPVNAADQIAPSVNTTTKHIYVLQGNAAGSTSAVYIDSASTPAASHVQINTGTATGLFLCNSGAGNQLLGSVGYFLAYNRIVSGADLSDIVLGLGAKFGITTT